MSKKKFKTYIIKVAIGFIILLGILTYFSTTIDNMLLPQVKVTEVTAGMLDGSYESMETSYLLPLSSVVNNDENATAYIISYDKNEREIVHEISVEIKNEDSFYYEVRSKELFEGYQVIYETSKDISDGDRVYIEEA